MTNDDTSKVDEAERAELKLLRAAERLAKFGANTSKTTGRLRTANDVNARCKLLTQYWQEFNAAWDLYEEREGDDKGKYTDEWVIDVEDNYTDAVSQLDALLERVTIGEGSAQPIKLQQLQSLQLQSRQEELPQPSQMRQAEQQPASQERQAEQATPQIQQAEQQQGQQLRQAEDQQLPQWVQAPYQPQQGQQQIYVPFMQANDGPVALRIRALEPPTFAGHLEEWISFRDFFEQLLSTITHCPSYIGCTICARRARERRRTSYETLVYAQEILKWHGTH